MDRLSNLPEEIICHTLSFLSTKEAATTCILSRRWRNLFAFTRSLCFEDKDFVDYNENFTYFLDRVLSISGNSPPLKKFSLEYRKYRKKEEVSLCHINRWIRNVVSRGTLNHLHIDLNLKYRTTLPLEIFTCKTLVTLRLGGFFVSPVVPEGASLPALKTIFLEGIHFPDQTFEAFLCACHVLEELVIDSTWYEDLEWFHTVSCTTLQSLTIVGVSGGEGSLASVCFDTPTLAYLYYLGCVPREYRIVNLDSLVEANICFISPRFVISCDPTNLIKGLRNIKILKLSFRETSETFYLFKEAIPVLEKLSHLSRICSAWEKYWRLLPVLLKKSPNLESLFIEDFYLGCIDNGMCECVWSCPVKVLEIAEFSGTVQEIEQIEHLLKKLPCLELLKVRASTPGEKPKLQLASDPVMNLLTITKACKIHLEFISS